MTKSVLFIGGPWDGEVRRVAANQDFLYAVERQRTLPLYFEDNVRPYAPESAYVRYHIESVPLLLGDTVWVATPADMDAGARDHLIRRRLLSDEALSLLGEAR